MTEALSELVHELSGRPRLKSSLLGRLMKSAARQLQGIQSNNPPVTFKASPTMTSPATSAPAPVVPDHEADETVPPKPKIKNGEPSFNDTFGDPYQSNKP